MAKVNLGRISGFSFMPKDEENNAYITCEFVNSQDKHRLDVEFQKGAYLYIEVEDINELDGL